MNGLIRFSLGNRRAVTVLMLAIVLIGGIAATTIPRDILPVYNSPAVQVLTFYGGMPAKSVEADITARMERWCGQSAGKIRQESKSLVGASIIRNFYSDDVDPSAALTQVNSLATAAIPNLPPGTLPPVILPYDPTTATPVALIALDSHSQNESTLYDVGRYDVRNMIMEIPGANAPVVYGGRLRTILAFLDREKLQARNLSAVDVMDALDKYNIFMPAGDAKLGDTDWALDSNSMYQLVDRMGDIPIRTDENNRTIFLRDVARPRDDALIQTNVVRVGGRRQVYIPVYRSQGASTLDVVNQLRQRLPDMKARLSTPDIDLKLVMDQSIYVKKGIESLAEEGILGAILCSLVILIFLGEWRMTAIAVMTIPVAVLGAIAGLSAAGQTINVMTLAGLALAIGPLVDSAIICLENTHRHLGLGAKPREAAFLGASEVAMPELVASLCTLLVLAPLAFMPGGKFLFRPMFLAVTFAMCIAYVLSRTFVPSRCANWLKAHGPKPIESHTYDYQHRNPHENARSKSKLALLFEKWEAVIDRGIAVYTRLLEKVLRARGLVIAAAFGLLAVVIVFVGPRLRREFFPEVDAGAFEIYVRAKTGTKIEATEEQIAHVEEYIKKRVGDDLELVISEIGLTADWSAAFTPNSGPMDAVVKVQLKPERARSAQEYVDVLRRGFKSDPEFVNRNADIDLEFAFDAGGMIRSAMNEGKSTPINIRITAKGEEGLAKAHKIAEKILEEVKPVPGVVDARILERLDYPQYMIKVDQTAASQLQLTQMDVMRNLVASLNSSVQFNKRNFWIDPVKHNQYYVGVQYPEKDITSLETLKDIQITSAAQKKSVPLRNLAELHPMEVPAEVVHTDLQSTIELTMGVHGRDLGHVAEDVRKVVARHGRKHDSGGWVPFDPDVPERKTMEGARIVISGEYQKMQQTFVNQAKGLALAVVLVYFLMVALFKSYVTPLVVMSAVPIGVVGVILMLWLTGTPLNVQSLLGVIFMVGIVVSNTVLLTDFAQNLRRTEKLTPTEAIRKAAAIRVRPVVMTACATFFALIPMAIGIGRGSEANVPLGRAVLGGLLAGLFTTLFVVPAFYSLLVHGKVENEGQTDEMERSQEASEAG